MSGWGSAVWGFCSGWSRAAVEVAFSCVYGGRSVAVGSRCENYFEMYGVESSIWVRVASMHMEGVAAHWLQSTERRVRSATWDAFCSLIHDHFSRDQHEVLIRQLFHIR
jgi:hypothetical protein